MKYYLQRTVLIGVIVLLWGCQTTRESAVAPASLPDDFVAGISSAPATDRWLAAVGGSEIVEIVQRALSGNRTLRQLAQGVEIAREQLVISGADRLPSIRLTSDAQRGKATSVSSVQESYTLAGALDFEIDLWGRLSDAQRQAQLDFAAEQSRYLRAERELAARTVTAVFDVMAAKQLLAQFEHRLESLVQSTDVIERGYRSGLNPALDVYLARTTVEQERANVESQRQVVFEVTNALALLLADYPNALQMVPTDFPRLSQLAGHGVPADLLQRRADIQQAWLELLSTDSALAVAQKNRFPVLNLSSSIRDGGTSLDDLVDGGQMAWSVAASLFQPVFQDGRLRRRVRQAEYRVRQAEERYLDAVYAAFAQAENELYRAGTLENRLQATEQVSRNAEAALTIAQDQYQRGLVPYTTVLESQRRAFDAQATLIRLRSQIHQSRVNLHLALGGPF